MGQSLDVIPVRAEESFPIHRLARYLEGKVVRAEGTPSVGQFAGGHANLTYLLTYPGVELVLRRPPLGPVAPGSHDMSREYRVLSRLHRAFSPAPEAFLFCDDVAVMGAPFLVMERKTGVVIRNVVPAMFGSGEDRVANRKLSEVVVDTLADLHSVDPASCDLADLGRPDGFLGRQVEGWITRWEAAQHEPNPLADDLADWIRTRLPKSPAPTIIHNDWRLDNMAVDPVDPGRCTAVYDWDMCTRGDPLADLGTVMGVWYEADEMPATLNPMPTSVPGFMSRAEAIERYAEKSGADLRDFNWYLVFGTWKLGVVLQQIFIRWHRGQTHDERFASMGAGAHRLFELAAARRW
ncbi:MAG: phosphotransferase family protein [Acidimicrobiia bacterium]|nr:phosphotransferase family protein [Acidimicrobiia bacterium]